MPRQLKENLLKRAESRRTQWSTTLIFIVLAILTILMVLALKGVIPGSV